MFEFAFAHPAHSARSGFGRIDQSPVVGRLRQRALDESLARVFETTGAEVATRSASMDVSETDIAYTVMFDVPGVRKPQLKVTVEGRKLTLQTLADAAPASDAAGSGASSRMLYRERTAPNYARTVSLPAEVDATSAQATLTDGVLTLVLSKRVALGETQVNVN